jgi:hypothetical protein
MHYAMLVRIMWTLNKHGYSSLFTVLYSETDDFGREFYFYGSSNSTWIYIVLKLSKYLVNDIPFYDNAKGKHSFKSQD